MSDKKWRTSYMNHLIKMAKGEEPNAFVMNAHDAQGKAHMGEYLIEYALTHGRLPGRMRCWSNVLVPKEGPVVDEAELDVLMLHNRGILVFESKNYSGWIFGSADQKMWTQTLNRRTKNRFFNPIRQNDVHVRVLSEHLDVPADQFLSYIVFSDRCELKDVPTSGPSWRVCHRDDLMRIVRADLSARDDIYSYARYAELEGCIEALASASTTEAREFHVQDVKMAGAGNVCPRCGGALVERKGKYGTFMGCTNYPRCRFTRNC